jgi:hypothetical protein
MEHDRSQIKEHSMSVVEHRDVYETPDARSETTVASTRFSVSPGQVIGGVLGIVIAIVGAITVARAGIDGSLDVPIVRTAGFDLSAMVGLAGLGIGLLLILGSLSYEGRGLMIGTGVVMVIGGVVVGAASTEILQDLGTVHGTGWAVMVAGIIAIVAGCLPRMVSTRQSIKTR